MADFAGFERVAHLRPVPLPGGAAAIREPWRMALAWTALAAGPEAAARLGPTLDPRWSQVLGLAGAGSHGGGHPAVLTSSAGRLFDAVAALVGLRSRITYEGQAAIETEMLAGRIPRTQAPCYPAEVIAGGGSGGARRGSGAGGSAGGGSAGGLDVLDPAPLVTTVLSEIERGTDRAVIAAGFHEGLGRATAALASRLAGRHGLDTSR